MLTEEEKAQHHSHYYFPKAPDDPCPSENLLKQVDRANQKNSCVPFIILTLLIFGETSGVTGMHLFNLLVTDFKIVG